MANLSMAETKKEIEKRYYYMIMDLHPDRGKELVGTLMQLSNLNGNELEEILSSLQGDDK